MSNKPWEKGFQNLKHVIRVSISYWIESCYKDILNKKIIVATNSYNMRVVLIISFNIRTSNNQCPPSTEKVRIFIMWAYIIY